MFENNIIRTTYERSVIEADITLLETKLYETTDIPIDEILKKSVSDLTYEFILLFKENIVSSINDIPYAGTIEIIPQIKKYLETLTPIKLTIAIAPDERFLSELHTWMKQYITTLAIIDLTIDREILGGAIISIDGAYKNLSARKELSTLFENKKILLDEHRRIRDIFNI